jgi:hypothetical protein
MYKEFIEEDSSGCDDDNSCASAESAADYNNAEIYEGILEDGLDFCDDESCKKPNKRSCGCHKA